MAPVPDLEIQVLVVGAGPVGLSLAVDLARRGVAVRIIDALAEPTEESPVVRVARPVRDRTIDWLQSTVSERGIKMHITASHWMTRFDLKHGQVPEYRSGRIFLAGDAAHIHSPAGALGMSTGIQDAVTLGWKLATALSTQGGERLLDSYHLERHPIGAQVVALTTEITKVATLKNPVARRLQNTLMHPASTRRRSRTAWPT